MTITADTRSSAPTASGPPGSAHSSGVVSQAEIESPYGMMPGAPARSGTGERPWAQDTEPTASTTSSHKPHPPRRRLSPAPVRARVVAGVIDLVVGSLLGTGLTALIWQVGGRPVMTSALIAFGVVVGLRWLAIAATGWSLGGILLRIRMLGARNQTPSPLGSFLHADLILAVSITTLGLGTIALMRTAAADPEGRGWHDKLSGMALLHARKTNRPGRDNAAASAPTGYPAGRPAPASVPTDTAGAPRAPGRDGAPNSAQASPAATGSPTGSTTGPVTGGTGDATRTALPTQPTEEPASAAVSAHLSPGLESEAAPRSRRRRDQKAEKKAEKALRRASRAGSASPAAGTGPTAGTAEATVGAQSATEAGVDTSPGGTAHPTTSDPVSSSIRRPRPARPGQPARHAGRALAAGSPSSAPSRKASATAAAYTSAVSGGTVSADGYGVVMAPRTAKAAKAATVSSASAASAASASPAVSHADAAAVAAASATPMDPQASAALAAAEASARTEAAQAVDEPSTPSAEPSGTSVSTPGPRGTAAAPSQAPGTVKTAEVRPATTPTPRTSIKAKTVGKDPVVGRSAPGSAPSKQPSQMDAETATLEAIDDTPGPSGSTDKATNEAEKPSSHAPPASQHPADQQSPEATTPSAESSKTAADSKASQASPSQDATPSTQVPRSKATKPVTSQTMEPRHAHAQRWRIQPGSSGKKSSGSSAAPAEDQREPASQPGVPRRESLFASDRHRFASAAGSAPEVAHTFDTSSILPSGDRNTQALIDSVPWSSVPTSVDAATVDSLPDGVIVSDDVLSRKPSAASVPASSSASPVDLTNPATVPGGVPASSASTAHPTVRSHRSHAQTSGSSGSASTAARDETPSRRSHSSHRFQGPGIPAPAEEETAAHSESHDESHGGDLLSGGAVTEAPLSRRERRDSAQAAARSRTSSAASTSRRGGAHTGHSASSAASSSAGTAAPAVVSQPSVTPVPTASAQTATPSLPSASSAAPALSVRLVPLLGGNPILIHEPTVVGRDPDNISAYPGAERVALDDPTRSVSKTHAAIFPLLDGVWVTDLHSTNGTRVEYRDGRSVEAVPDKALSALEGSTIYFGRIAFKVEVV